MKINRSWGILTIFNLVFGFKFFVLGQTSNEMLRGVLLLAIAGMSLSQTFQNLATKEEKQ